MLHFARPSKTTTSRLCGGTEMWPYHATADEREMTLWVHSPLTESLDLHPGQPGLHKVKSERIMRVDCVSTGHGNVPR